MKRIAVLGGGTGALSAAWALTNLPDASARYEIRVYQMGWRLGGKGASGRNPCAGNRIQEHGLHVWAGFYENAFRVMQECYGALRTTGGSAIAEWTDAFKKHSAVMLEELVDGSWRHWPLTFPENDDVPGTGGEIPTPWEYLKLVVSWIVRELEGREVAAHEPLKAASHLAGSLAQDVSAHLAHEHASLLKQLKDAHDLLADAAARPDLPDDLRRLLILADIGLATTKGILGDGVLFHGFSAIDGIEWRAWLAKHGASPAAVSSAFVRAIYDYVFGFRGGHSEAMELEAGTATHGVLRLVLTYKGALFWEMQAGMGDIVFAPLYRALRARGVQFAFFHKVDNLAVSADGPSIERIKLTRQAVPKAGFEPLIDVKGVPSWPGEPLYDQLEDGERLKASGIDLESAWAEPVGVPLVLERGRDFDDVILGISLGAFKDVCGELIAANNRFADMVTNLGTVQTASMQLWLDPAAAVLQAPDPPRIVSAYAELLNTWADMSFLLPREEWPQGSAPRFLAYFCSEFPDAEVIPPYSDHGFPARELARYQAMATDWLSRHVGHIWPGATAPGSPTALDLALLHGQGSGEERLAGQYFRVNIDPTERYVLSLPGTSRFRLRAGESGFQNLYLAGDWVRTSINAGCVEAAVMAGLDAASALSGVKIPIVGGLD